MSATSHNSSAEYALEPMSVGASSSSDGVVFGQTGIWLDGDVLACACPDCGAPMSIRLWLMVADCFRCGSTIELTEEQEQEALRLLREREEAKRVESAAVVAAISPTMVRKPHPKPAETQALRPAAAKAEPGIDRPAPEARAMPGAAPAAPAAQPTPQAEPRPRHRRVAAAQVHRGARAKVHEIYEKGGLAVWWADMFSDLPAWLVSLVVHLVAILLLAMWMDDPRQENLAITLATSVSYQAMEGEQGEIEEAQAEAFEFDDPGAVELENVADDIGSPAQADFVDLEATDSAIDVMEPVGDLPDRLLRERIPVSTGPVGRMYQGRNPDVRAQIVRREGGTTYTEAAVARSLKWLSRHQNADGSWSLHAFNKAPGAEGKGDKLGTAHSDMAGTALALLPFLGAGQTHMEGEYADVVMKGLRWIVEHQGENGDCRGSGDGRMYAHGQATIVLSEAYALTGDEQLREPAQLALNYIVKAQHHAGGWRYEPGQPGDTSVVGWQLMAIKSGQMAYLHVPSKTFELAGVFLDAVKRDELGGRYAYMPGNATTPAMTAEALLCRQYLGWPKNHPGLKDGVEFLIENHLPDAGKPNIYYWYYGTQVMHHYGGEPWEKWNDKMRQVLVELQESEGYSAGSWTPLASGHDGGFADRGGRIYMTSLATCILEVYYRHMPIYRKDILEGFD